MKLAELYKKAGERAIEETKVNEAMDDDAPTEKMRELLEAHDASVEEKKGAAEGSVTQHEAYRFA